LALKIIGYQSKKFKISYEITNKAQKKAILFLHGWGSSKELMKQAFGKLLSDYRHIYVDLPGFGRSSCDIPLRSEDYAKILRIFLEQIEADPKIIVGHSFGGKVATLLNPQLLVLLSSAGITWPKPLKIRLKIAVYKLIKPLGKGFRNVFVSQDAKNMSEIMYQTFKNVVDENFRNIFSVYTGKALLFWGKEDSATPLKSAYEIKKLMKNSELYILDGDHYFFLHHTNFIAQKIKETYEKMSM